ncbi:MAG: tetratricopeptide repeat protein [Kofleriaceae bacterium]
MKSLLLKNIVFVSLVSLAACGGDRSTPAPTVKDSGSSTMPLPEPIAIEPTPEVISPIVKDIKEPLAIPASYAAAMELGKKLAEKGDMQAKDMFEAAAKLNKKSSEPHVELARFFINKNERANAIKSANKAVKLAPESSQAYNTLGRAELLRHNYDAAILAFRQATELNADNVWAWNNLGFVQLTLKKYDEAIDSLLTATSKKGATGYMWNNLGTAYEHLDQLDEAREAFESGGKLGSSEALASRKRLEGVDTIVVINKEPTVEEKSYETREEMPEIVEEVTEEIVEEVPEPMAPVEDGATDEMKLDVKVEEVKVDDETKADEPKTDEVHDEVKAAAPAAPSTT